MDIFVNAMIGLMGIAVGVVGSERIRRWIRLEEPEPYFVAGVQDHVIDKDPVVGPIVKAEKALGNKTLWVQSHQALARKLDGCDYLRAGRRRIMFRSKQMAHGDSVVLMVRRGGNQSDTSSDDGKE